jgi:hypothetical protein
MVVSPGFKYCNIFNDMHDKRVNVKVEAKCMYGTNGKAIALIGAQTQIVGK